MKAKNVTLKVNSDLYDAYMSYCKRNEILVSRQFEIMMEEKLGPDYKRNKSNVRKIGSDNGQEYVGSLTGEPFMMHENKIIAGLLLENKPLGEIKKIVVEDNLFGYKTIKSVPKRVNSIIKRIGNFEHFILEKIKSDLSGDGKTVILYSIYLRDRLFKELLNELISNKFSIRDLTIQSRNIRNFIDDKSDSETKLQEFTKETKYKLSNVMLNILKEAGLVVSTGKGYRLNNVLITSDLKNYLINKKETRFIKSIGGQL